MDVHTVAEPEEVTMGAPLFGLRAGRCYTRDTRVPGPRPSPRAARRR